MSDIAIKVENLSKKYVIGSGTSGSLRETLSSVWHNTFGVARTEEEEFWALQDINFEIKQGEAVGIIGSNGAGKSTLLKLLSKITYPTTGKISMNGRVSSLLEVGTGFHPELTGRENIYLNGTILGMTRKEVKSKFDEIVDFSGVGRFLDTPVKRYSSGMYVRLAFAVAAHLEPEILIIDEVLAVGDADFQKKCLGKMDEVAKEGRTVLFVSHNMQAVQSLCKKGVFLSNSRLISIGRIDSIIESYASYSKKSNDKISILSKNFKINELLINNHESIYTGQNFSIKIKFSDAIVGDKLRVVFDIIYGTEIIFRLINQNTTDYFLVDNKAGSISCTINKLPLTKGDYKISIKIYSILKREFLINSEYVKTFSVINAPFFGDRLIDKHAGKVLVDQNWIMK